MGGEIVEKVARAIGLRRGYDVDALKGGGYGRDRGLQIWEGLEMDAREAIAAYEAAKPLELTEVLGATNARRVDLLEPRIAALEDALRPFAEGANDLSSEWRDEDNLAVVYDEDPENVGLFRFNVGDLRRARAVLNEK